MKFTVVTPSFNQLEWLDLCAASVADQTGSGIEVEHIVQDAGSPGIEEWARRHPGVKVFVEKDEGMYDAVNRGLRRATGEICAYLNCDEQYLPGALRRVAAHFQKHPATDVLFADTLLLDAEGRPASYRRVVRPTRLHVKLCHLNTFTCSTFFRRSLVECGHLFNTRWRAIGDAVWVHGLLNSRAGVAVLRDPMAAFAMTGENLGQGMQSVKERAEWRGRRTLPQGAVTLCAVLQHRLRKLLAGAYRHRTLDVDLFTLQSPAQRVRMRADGIGYGWTGAVMPSKV